MLLKKFPHWFDSESRIFRAISYLSLLFFFYGLNIFRFDFFSDDFGYFLNFSNLSNSGAGIKDALVSYLTGGVPRLQIGWHVIHQVLHEIFGTTVVAYYLFQILLIFLNCLLIDFLFYGYLTGAGILVINLAMIFIPTTAETFYWVSANYGLFQIFFFLLALLAMKSSSRLFFALGTLSLAFSMLFQEQMVPLFFIFPIIARLIYRNSSISKRALAVTFGAGILLLILFSPQFLLIWEGSKTSLLDTLKMYYPNPISDSARNIGTLLRNTLFGLFPSFQYTSLIASGYSELSGIRKAEYVGQIIAICSLIFLIFLSMPRKGGYFAEKRKSISVIALALFWFLGSSLIVIPIVVITSRYYLLVLPSTLFFLLFLFEKLNYQVTKITFCIALFISAIEHLSLYHLAHFRLVDFERQIFLELDQKLSQFPKTKVLVFNNVPSNIRGVPSGVWLNYHAAEWWFSWRSKPSIRRLDSVGLAAFECRTEEGVSGFRVIYGDYPLERLQKCYPSDEVTFVNADGLKNQEAAKISLSQRKPIEKLFKFNVDVDEKESPQLLSLALEDVNLQYCVVNWKIEIAENRGRSSFRLISKGGKFSEDLVANSSGEASGQLTLYAQSQIKEVGPYYIQVRHSKSLFGPQSSGYTKVKAVEMWGCGGKGQNLAKFMGNHNPDPLNPYLRWSSPAALFTVSIPYSRSSVWERQFGNGVNDIGNYGDFYCFPDDELTIFDKNGSFLSQSYLGMLRWNRLIEVNDKRISIKYKRGPGFGIAERGSIDKMSVEEYESYSKDEMDLEIQQEKLFWADKSYARVIQKIKSKANRELIFRWTYVDSAAQDFSIGTDRGVQTVTSKGLFSNQMFITNDPYVNGFPINFRSRIPYRDDIASLEFSCDTLLESAFSGDLSPDEGIGEIEPLDGRFMYFPNSDISHQTHGLMFSGTIPSGDDAFSGVLSLGKRYRHIESRVGRSFYLPNSDIPHRTHGLTFSGAVLPGQEIEFSYYMIFVVAEGRENIIKRANQIIEEIRKNECK